MVHYNGKEFICLLDFAMEFIRGKWKSILLCHLYEAPRRFLELQKSIEGLSQKVLNEKLKELESEGLVDKIIYPEIPPKVEYFLTDKGKDLYEIIAPLKDWSIKYYPDLDENCE